MPRFYWRCRKTSGNEQTKSPLSAATDRKTPPCKGGVIFFACFSHTNPSTFCRLIRGPRQIPTGNSVGFNSGSPQKIRKDFSWGSTRGPRNNFRRKFCGVKSGVPGRKSLIFGWGIFSGSPPNFCKKFGGVCVTASSRRPRGIRGCSTP